MIFGKFQENSKGVPNNKKTTQAESQRRLYSTAGRQNYPVAYQKDPYSIARHGRYFDQKMRVWEDTTSTASSVVSREQEERGEWRKLINCELSLRSLGV